MMPAVARAARARSGRHSLASFKISGNGPRLTIIDHGKHPIANDLFVFRSVEIFLYLYLRLQQIVTKIVQGLKCFEWTLFRHASQQKVTGAVR